MSNGNAQTYEQSPAAWAARRRLVMRINDRVTKRDTLPREARWRTCERVSPERSIEQFQEEWYWFFFRNEIPDEAA